MTTRTYAFLAGAAASAMAAWWWTRNQAGSMGPAPRERGTVIFDNTPVASLEADLDFVPTR
ncbi:MAG: hypothetical protein H0W18_00970 [Acidobacteria bacterium]|nr:hypothetical protein [Acidobacteriota bacterium]